MSEPAGDFGLIGLAVMGQNLILNINDHGYTVVAYNRTVSKVDHFLANEAKGTNIIGAKSIEDLASKLKRPRKIMLLVKAGSAVDDFIEQIIPHLDQGDIIIDGGNSHFPDTIRRCKYLEDKGFLFIGCGVSGGEDGARYGPSLMPGGSKAAWEHVKPIFQSIAAKANDEPCCDWVGETGAGHYVKMVHNGIEYGDMQLICEAYHLMKEGLDLTHDEIGDVFENWNKGELDSFLIDITKDIVRFKDEDGSPLVEKIKDTAGQKGTGKWTAISSLDLGIPVTLIGEAVYSRTLSALKDERVRASKILPGPKNKKFKGDKQVFIKQLGQALYASKLISYAQGFMLMREAAKDNDWDLNNAGIALMWRGGCIIRSAFLGDIKNAYTKNPKLENLLFDPFFKKAIDDAQDSWRQVVAEAAILGIPAPALSTALSFYDGYRHEKLPANLLQAQRDYFGAHTFRYLDEYVDEKHPKDKDVHVNWTGHGGNVSSSAYLA
ncbi:6-phosphogluconate dehydrogenase, decarboxylating [Glomus cerebriforme]|uniref:6-phosphogluconate dehydrogenase, decarboxylating n=1 Tax=Glomus cerebriforme TaxID=658196 RepID=A0A397SMF9_9GLOM|nr:6-phosphogluconate dehydrogenase, decarboxylating [Glomus cerebriforme]